MMKKHSCKSCIYCRGKKNYKEEHVNVCTLFEDDPEINVWKMHFCEMYKERSDEG